MPEYLPPVVTELKGDNSDLARTFAEADALGKEYVKKQKKTIGDGGTEAGKTGGKNLVENLRMAVEGAPFDMDKLTKQIDSEFRKAGKDGAEDLLKELAAAVGNDNSDLTTQLHNRIDKAFGTTISKGDTALKKYLAEQIGEGGNDGGEKAAKSTVAKFVNEIPLIGNAIASAVTNGGIEAEGAVAKAFSALPPEAQLAIGVGIAGAITASASFIGATLNGVLLAGFGAGGIALGIASQIHDPAVVDAAHSLAADVKSEMKTATKDFAPELVGGLQDAQRAWDKLGPGLESTFHEIAPDARILIDGMVNLATNAAPGFENAIKAGGAVLQDLGENELPRIGSALSLFANLLSQGSKGGASGLHDLITLFDDLLIATGAEVDLLAHMWQGFAIAKDIATGNIGDLTTRIFGAGNASRQAAQDQQTFKSAVEGATAAVARGRTPLYDMGSNTLDLTNRTDALTRSIDKDIDMLGSWSQMFDTINGKAISMQQATDQFDIAIGKLTTSIDKHGRSLQGDSVAAATNREAIIALIQQANSAAQAAYNMAVQNGNSAGAAKIATDTYNKMTQQILNAASAAGLNKQQVQALITELGKIPKNVTSTITIQEQVKLIDNGNKLPSGYRIQRAGGVVPAAAGLIADQGTRPLVQWAEPGVGREGYVPERGISQTRAYNLLQEMAGWHGMSVSSPSGGGAATGGVSTRVLAPVNLVVGGVQAAQAFVEFLVPAAVDRKARKGTTGLS